MGSPFRLRQLLPGGSLRHIGPRRTLIDPGTQHSDFPSSQSRTSRRHLEAILSTGYTQNQRALVTAPNNDCRSRIPALERRFLLVEAQAIHLHARPVALVAFRVQDGFDVAHEIDLRLNQGRQFFLRSLKAWGN